MQPREVSFHWGFSADSEVSTTHCHFAKIILNKKRAIARFKNQILYEEEFSSLKLKDIDPNCNRVNFWSLIFLEEAIQAIGSPNICPFIF